MKNKSRFLKTLVSVLVVAALCIPFMSVAHAATGMLRTDNPRLFDALVNEYHITPGEPGFISSTQLAGLSGTLNLADHSLRTCEGLQYCTGISELYLDDNNISDLDQISMLDNLTYLNVLGNRLTFISQLSTLHNIQTLVIAENQINSLQGVENMHNLHALEMGENHIDSLRPIYDLPVTQLTTSYNFLNPTSEGAYDYYDVVMHLGLFFDTTNWLDEGQYTFNIHYDGDAFGSPARALDTGVYYKGTITLPTVTVTNPDYTFIGWTWNNGPSPSMPTTGSVTFSPWEYTPASTGSVYDATISARYDTPHSHGKLASLTGSVGTVSPAFYALRYTGYTLTIPQDYSDVTVSASAWFPEDNVKIAGRTRTSYTVHIAHPGQHKSLTVKVTSAVSRRDYRIYHLTVQRAPSSNAFLTNIRVTPYFSSPTIYGFDPWETDQYVATPYNKSKVTVKPLPAGYGAKVYINGHRCTSRSIRLGTYGSETLVDIHIVSQDGSNTIDYTLHLLRNSPGG